MLFIIAQMRWHIITLHAGEWLFVVPVCFVGWRLDCGVWWPDICHREGSRAHGPVHAAGASACAVQALPGQHEPAFQAVLEDVWHAPDSWIKNQEWSVYEHRDNN